MKDAYLIYKETEYLFPYQVHLTIEDAERHRKEISKYLPFNFDEDTFEKLRTITGTKKAGGIPRTIEEVSITKIEAEENFTSTKESFIILVDSIRVYHVATNYPHQTLQRLLIRESRRIKNKDNYDTENIHLYSLNIKVYRLN